jgi:hypothetical protein
MKKMKPHARTCPIDFQDMFDENLNWENEEDNSWINYLTYEAIFHTPDYDVEDLLRYIGEEDEDYRDLESCFDPEPDENYSKKWQEVPGANEVRFLFYGIGDRANRRGKDVGEIYWFLEILQRRGIKFKFPSEKNEFGEDIIVDDSVIEVYAPNDDVMMTLYPCCPKCHTILPSGWFKAVDYYPIALLSHSTGGKTTLMCSWLVNNFEVFNDLGRMSKNIDVLYGIDGGIDNFKIQSYIYEQADRMYKTGQYPDGTDKIHIPPVYMQIVNHTGENLIVGIYDCSGEILADAALQRSVKKQNVIRLLKYMSAFIYLVEAKDMVGVQIETEESQELPELLDVEEQGNYQEEHREEYISAREVLHEVNWNGQDPWAVYNAVMQVLQRVPYHKRHMAFTIIKSDELVGRPEVKSIPKAESLLKNPPITAVMNKDYMLEANMIAREMFRQLVFDGTNDQDKEARILAKEWDFNKTPEDNNVSWHCVCASALPVPRKKFKYRAVRNAEPLIGCLLGKLDELGWLDQGDL